MNAKRTILSPAIEGSRTLEEFREAVAYISRETPTDRKRPVVRRSARYGAAAKKKSSRQ